MARRRNIVLPWITHQRRSRTVTDAGNLGTAAVENTGTSGNNVPLLDGNNTWSAPQTITTTVSGQPVLTAVSTSAGASLGPYINVHRDSASPAAGDGLGSFRFTGTNAALSTVTYGVIDGVLIDPTTGSEDAYVRIRSITAGALPNVIARFGPGVAIGTAVDQGAGTFNAPTIYEAGTSLAAKYVVGQLSTDGTFAGNLDTLVPSQKATKLYVDTVVAGFHYTDSVLVATTVAGTLASSFENGDTVDGVVLATGNRILIKNQVAGAENGIYTVNASGVPTRSTDADTGAELKGIACLVTSGTVNANSQWSCSNATTITINSTVVTFAQIGAGATAYVGGTGLSLTGNTFDIDDPELLAILGITTADVDQLPYFTSATEATTTTLTPLARDLLDDVDPATMRTTLELGTTAVKNTGTSGNNVPLLDGTNTWSALQTITVTTAGQPALTAVSTNSGASLGPYVNAHRESGSPAAGDGLGSFRFTGTNAALSTVTYGAIDGVLIDPTTGSEDAYIRIRSITAGALPNVIARFGPGVAIGTAVDQGVDTFNASTIYEAGTSLAAKYVAGTLSTDGTFAANLDTNIPSQKATKAYVDNVIAGLHYTDSVRLATTVAGTLASSFENGDTIDGVVLATGNRILIKNQAADAENGIYTVNASGVPTRATDADTGAELKGIACLVTAGTSNANTQWSNSNATAITLGSTAVTFAQIGAGATAYTAGAGLTLTGNSFAISDTELLAIRGITTADADQLPYFTSTTAATTTTLTSFARGLLDDVNLAAMHTTLDIAATIAAQFNAITPTTRHIYTSDTTWSKPALLDYVIVRLCGGGGGGGGTKGNGTDGGAGAGGGSGGWSEHMVVAADLGDTVAVTVGAAGTGGADTPASGVAGGVSSFGVICTANGGVGGIGRTASASQAGTPGAAGGVAGTGNILAAPGTPGTPPVSGGVSGSADRVSGNGGGTPWGGGAAGKTASTGSAAVGNNAVGRGAGGGGAVVRGATTDGASGGNGQKGVVEVTEFYRMA